MLVIVPNILFNLRDENHKKCCALLNIMNNNVSVGSHHKLQFIKYLLLLSERYVCFLRTSEENKSRRNTTSHVEMLPPPRL